MSKFYDIAVSGSSDDENAQPTREHVKTRRNAVSLFSERIPKTTLSDDTTDEWSDLAIVNKTEDVGDQSVIGEFTDEINIELLDKNSSHNESSSGVDALANKPSDTNYENNAEQLVDPAVSSLTGLASATRGGAAEPAVSSSTEVASPIKPAIEPYVFKSVLLRINSIDLSVSIRVDAPVGEIIT